MECKKYINFIHIYACGDIRNFISLSQYQQLYHDNLYNNKIAHHYFVDIHYTDNLYLNCIFLQKMIMIGIKYELQSN